MLDFFHPCFDGKSANVNMEFHHFALTMGFRSVGRIGAGNYRGDSRPQIITGKIRFTIPNKQSVPKEMARLPRWEVVRIESFISANCLG